MKSQLTFLFDYVFPNGAMPNALVAEYGLLNYLNSYHVDNMLPDALTDPSSFNSSYTIFNNKLGSWPNSLRQNSSHLNSPFYEDHFAYIEDSLYFKRSQVNKYIYLIKITPHIDDFIAMNLGSGNKMNGEYFWKHMSSMALKDVRQGRALIFLDFAQENFIEKTSFENLHKVLQLGGLPKEQVIIAFNATNAQEVYESWFSPDERQLIVKSWPWVMCNASFHYNTNLGSGMTIETLNETKNVIRPNHFLFKVRSPRSHRLILLFKMASDELLEKADWSCLNSSDALGFDIDVFTSQYQIQLDKEKVQELYTKLPHVLQSEKDLDHRTISAWTDKNADAHRNSYFYVCTETYVHGEYKMLTEKVFKPIANFQPFVFLAYPGALQLLRDLGFRTFSPFIDESYDTEPNEIIRIQKIYAEITRLCNMSKEEIHAWYWSMEDILIHNHNRVLELYNDDIKGIELIKYLVERTSS
jgi:hypothetical protein